MDFGKGLKESRDFYDRREFSSAVATLTVDIIQYGVRIETLELRSMCYFHLGQFENSLEDFNQAVLLEPNNPYRYSSRAYIRDAMGDIDGAILDYEKATHLDPEDAIAHNNLGLLLEKKGRMKQAKSHFKKADEAAPSFFQDKEENSGTEKVETTSPINNLGPDENMSHMGVIRQTISSRKGFNEFMNFIKNGFKLK